MELAILDDRLAYIKMTVEKAGIDKVYIAFSGGKDSTVLHHLVDLALPGNRIPRVFVNTGIEYQYIVDFVKELADKDDRFVIISPRMNIRQMLVTYGYPFKSKEHSNRHAAFMAGKLNNWVNDYLQDNRVVYEVGPDGKRVATRKNAFGCPQCLRCQFTAGYPLKLSAECCNQLKKLPSKNYERERERERSERSDDWDANVRRQLPNSSKMLLNKQKGGYNAHQHFSKNGFGVDGLGYRLSKHPTL